MKCPICGSNATKDNPQTPNGGELFIAEELGGDTSCFCCDITGYTCTSNPNHMFYIVEELKE